MPEEPTDLNEREYLKYTGILTPFKDGWHGWPATTMKEEFKIRRDMLDRYNKEFRGGLSQGRGLYKGSTLNRSLKQLNLFNAAAKARNTRILQSISSEDLHKETDNILRDQLFDYIPYKSVLSPKTIPEHENPVFQLQLEGSPHALTFNPEFYPGAGVDGEDGPLDYNRVSLFKNPDDFSEATIVWDYVCKNVYSMPASKLWKAFKTELGLDLDPATQVPSKGEFSNLFYLAKNRDNEDVLISLSNREDWPEGSVNPNHPGAFNLYTLGEDSTFTVENTQKLYNYSKNSAAHSKGVKEWWLNYIKNTKGKHGGEFANFMDKNFSYWAVMQLAKQDLANARFAKLNEEERTKLKTLGSLIARLTKHNEIQMGVDPVTGEQGATDPFWSGNRNSYIAADHFLKSQKELLWQRFPQVLEGLVADQETPLETQLNSQMRQLGMEIEKSLSNATTWGAENILTGEREKEHFLSFLNFFDAFGIDNIDVSKTSVEDNLSLKHASDIFAQYMQIKQFMHDNGMKSAARKYTDSYRPRVFKKGDNVYEFKTTGYTNTDKAVEARREHLMESEALWLSVNNEDPFGSLMNFTGFKLDERDLIAGIYYYNKIPEADTDNDKIISKEEFKTHMESTDINKSAPEGQEPEHSERTSLRLGEKPANVEMGEIRAAPPIIGKKK